MESLELAACDQDRLLHLVELKLPHLLDEPDRIAWYVAEVLSFWAGKKTRAELLEWVKAYDKQGVSKYLKFDENGDVDKSKVVIWAYDIAAGAFKPQQEIKLS